MDSLPKQRQEGASCGLHHEMLVQEEASEEAMMEHEQACAARKHMIMLMQAGHSWQEAAELAGVHISRSAAYRLLQGVRLRGEVALQDGRHGHPAKLRQPVREWLETTCREAPHTPSHVVQTALQERFGILISIGHLNRVRAELGVGSRVVRREKNSKLHVQEVKPTGKREQADSSW
jgi:transposase